MRIRLDRQEVHSATRVKLCSNTCPCRRFLRYHSCSCTHMVHLAITGKGLTLQSQTLASHGPLDKSQSRLRTPGDSTYSLSRTLCQADARPPSLSAQDSRPDGRILVLGINHALPFSLWKFLSLPATYAAETLFPAPMAATRCSAEHRKIRHKSLVCRGVEVDGSCLLCIRLWWLNAWPLP